MTLAIGPANALANAMADQITAKIDVSAAGTINIYDGTRPATADTAVVSQQLLVTLTFSHPSFGSAAAGAIAANAITDGTAVVTSTATWARIKDSTGATVLDLDVGQVGGASEPLLLTNTSIAVGDIVHIGSFQLKVQEQ